MCVVVGAVDLDSVPLVKSIVSRGSFGVLVVHSRFGDETGYKLTILVD